MPMENGCLWCMRKGPLRKGAKNSNGVHGNNKMAESGEAVIVEDEEGEFMDVLSSVISKRRSVPTKCMDMSRDIIEYEIKRLDTAEVRLEENQEKKKFLNHVRKLSSLKEVNLSFADVHKAEEKILKCRERLLEINEYLKRRKTYVNKEQNLNELV